VITAPTMASKSKESIDLIAEALSVAANVNGDAAWKSEQQARIMWSMLGYSKTHPDLPLDITLRMSLNDWELDYDKHIYPTAKNITEK